MRLFRLLSLSPLLFLPLCALLLAYPDGPDPKLTGGFGERTCLKCHQGHALNAGRSLGGVFHLEGVPREYEPGQTYPIRVVIGQPGQSRWGFELGARFADSKNQAGTLAPADGNTQLMEEDGIQYLMHSEDGTRAGQQHGPVEFNLNWTAPDSGGELVIFNAAGNAANGNDTEEGDFIYTAGAASLTAGAQPVAAPVVASLQMDEPPFERRVETPVLIAIPTPVDRRKGDFEVKIQHRFIDGIDSGAGQAFGIDSGANINLGIRYSLSDRLSAEVTRERFQQIVTLSGAYEIHHGNRWHLDFHGGVEATRNFQRHYSPFFQLAAAFDIQQVRLYVTPTMVFNSRNDQQVFPDDNIFTNPDDNHTFALGLGADVALNPWFSVVGEVIPRLAGFGSLRSRDDPAFGAGVKIRSWGHVFSIFVSKSRDFTPAAYAPSAFRENDDVSLGFNIYRRIR